MALPTKNNIQQLGFSLVGSPWCRVTAKSSINVDSLQFSLDGSPWWGHGSEAGTEPETGFKIWLGAIRVPKMYLGATEVSTAYLGTIQLT